MSVYKHQQGNYLSYRVARSVDGKLYQFYFPRTRKGLVEAKKRDEELAKDQERAQQFFTGPALRWQKKAKKVEKKASTKTKQAGSSAKAKTTGRKTRQKTAGRQATANATPKRATRSKSAATKSKSRVSKTKA